MLEIIKIIIMFCTVSPIGGKDGLGRWQERYTYAQRQKQRCVVKHILCTQKLQDKMGIALDQAAMTCILSNGE